jgi:non-specific serine/threonine protein kinase
MNGKTLSHYKIIKKLGRGGMGVVYKAEDTKLKRSVALKFLPPELTSDPEARQRFINEAQAASALDHQNICTVHEIDEDKDGQTFIVMACYEGETLKDKIQKGPIKVKEAVEIALQVAQGLEKTHKKGIIHRDIKPANIFVTDDGVVKIVDFGLAKLVGQVKLTRTGTTTGTIAYMSPEQIQASEADQRSDLWSLGVLLYEMITGELPFKGDYEAAIIYEILNAEHKAFQRLPSDVPENVTILISHLLQKDLNQRISSAREVISELKSPQTKQLSEAIKSIAVLYFENMSSDKETDYFCAGMTEDLITDLSKIRKIKVIPRSDILPYRNKEIQSRQVGEALHVHYIVEGSVRKGGDKIRITAKLIDLKSGYQIWAERYDRLVEDVFDVQIEVSEKIADALKVSLTESEKKLLAKKPTDDLRAYDFYMRGSEFLLQKGKKNNDAAIQMFEHAISIDPGFPLAYTGLAEAYSYNYTFYDGDRSWLEKTMEMNEKALELDPDLIEAQIGIGLVYFFQKRLTEAAFHLEKVLKIKQDLYLVLFWLGTINFCLEDYDTAVKFHQQGAIIKPYSEEPWHHLSMIFHKMGDLKSAREAAKKMVKLAQRKLEIDPEDCVVLSRIALTYAVIGESDKALKAAKKVEDIQPDDGIALYNCGATYTWLGKKDEALIYLKAACEKGFMNVIHWFKNDPYLESIRNDQKFREMLSKYTD